ncbi:MAG: cache domain-containing protein, partial [Synergistaceae bacterium]|nr:cache domain-containing protein [Synergistaceae bacterium]
MFSSIRKKVILAIIAIVIAITVAITGMSIVFTKSGLLKTVEKDMMVVADMGDKLVTSRIILLKTSVSAAAHRLNNVPDTQLREALRSLTEEYGDFMSLTVLDLKGVVDAYGKSTTPGEFAKNSYARMAFAGEKVISTTMNGRNGELVFYVLAPMRRGRLLSATVSGMLFSDILSQFKIWDTGNLFIMDSEGVIIANVHEDMVKGRYNFIELAKTDEGAKSA